MDRLAFIDVETDGLVRPGLPFPMILEVALILTDGDLVELDRYGAVISHTEAELAALDPDPFVYDMHEKSGLWSALGSPWAVSVGCAQADMHSILFKHWGITHSSPEHDLPIWAGFSPSAIDRPVLAHFMPAIYKCLHYRTLDLTSLRLAAQRWAGIESGDSDAAHRAMADTEESVRVAREFRSLFASVQTLVP